MAAKVLIAFAAVVPPIWGARSWIEKRLKEKLDRHAYRNDQQAMTSTLEVYRKDINNIYEVLRAQDKTAEERHRELLMHFLKKGEP